MAAAAAAGELELLAAIGFNGHVPCGLICHPDQEHVLYPLGCTVVIQKVDSKKQTFLHGHTNNVSCVVVSRDGVYVASGQVTFMGFKADIILWNYQRRDSLARLSLHKGRVEGLAFSVNSLYLVSLGGQDDGSVVVWHVGKREAVCGSPASARVAGNVTVVVSSSCRDEVFVTAGNTTIRVWELDLPNRKIRPTECQTGHLKRVITCIKMADDDSHFYVGTSSGDVLKVNTNNRVMTDYGPQKKKFSAGVTALLLLKTGDLIVGTGGGIVALCKDSNYKIMKKIQVQGAVTSLTSRDQGHQFFVGTNECQIYQITYPAFKEELITACHKEAVHDIVFPLESSDLFATCSKNDIRVWYTPEHRELLRIVVPENVTCHAIEITSDGSNIISAWDDRKIRAFMADNGELLYEINHAHSLGVTAIAATSDCKRIISGGGEGQATVLMADPSFGTILHLGSPVEREQQQGLVSLCKDIRDDEPPQPSTPQRTVRIWEIGEKTQKLGEVLKEHKSAVSCIKMKKDDRECVTASLDGSCIIWDIVRFVRKQMILANTLFKCVCYHPEEYQLITAGTDRRIGYWEVFDGSAVREVEGSASGSINGMDITSDGAQFVTGGDDHLVKLWDYAEGAVTHVGVGHSGNITRLRICPGNKYIVSVSADGAILIWQYPEAR